MAGPVFTSPFAKVSFIKFYAIFAGHMLSPGRMSRPAPAPQVQTTGQQPAHAPECRQKGCGRAAAECKRTNV